ncbi:MAG: polymer-forming cytoskeletal protein [Pseudomonadota bacterium]
MFHNMSKKTGTGADKKVLETSKETDNKQDQKNNSQTQQPNKKEEKRMNAPQQKDQNNQSSQNANASTENRVDVPGNNYARPGQAATGRPSYPGAYPGAAAAQQNTNYNPQPANEPEGRKLVIGQGISLAGEIEACDHLIVEGTVEAALKGASKMDIAEAGAFYGTVEIEQATIAGRFEGDIKVNGRLTVQSTGVIIGSVTYAELAIEAGASIEGSVTPINSQNAMKPAKSGSKAKTKVSQDNSAELPFSEKIAS